MSFAVSLDGVMVPIRPHENGREDASWREASCGTISFHDADGERLDTPYLARMPEAGKVTLKQQLADEVAHIRKVRPDLRLAALADAAADNWTFLDKLEPDVRAVDTRLRSPCLALPGAQSLSSSATALQPRPRIPKSPDATRTVMPMPGPLHGVRIVDLTSMVSGPSTTMMLADQGADVIKVENPLIGGDHTRAVSKHGGGLGAAYLNNNRNKRSIALDLKNGHGLRTLMRLATGADVLVQNFRPGVAARIGVGEEAVRAHAPSIVYVSIAGFGFTGPYAGRPVYDPLIQALSGLATVQAGSDDARPRLVRTILPDKLTGIVAAQAIAAALYAREKSGEGQAIELSMLDSVIAFLWGSDMESQTMVDRAIAQQHAQSFIDLIYETTDGYISVAVQQDKEWRALCLALDRPEWLDDERFATAAGRQRHIDDRLALTQEVLRTGSSAHWLARLEAEDVPCAPVLTRHAMLAHPQVVANGIVAEHDHPVAGRVRQARPAARFSKTGFELRQAGAQLGEHTDDVLAECGLDADEIATLRREGAFGPQAAR